MTGWNRSIKTYVMKDDDDDDDDDDDYYDKYFKRRYEL